MKVTLGNAGLRKSWQANFPRTTPCCRCGGKTRIGFVAHEGMDDDDNPPSGPPPKFVCEIHRNKGEGDYWLHDSCAVAVYFCKECMEATALYNQG